MENREGKNIYIDNVREDLISRYVNKQNKAASKINLDEQLRYDRSKSNLSDKSRIIKTWTDIQTKNIELRNSYAKWLLLLLAIQIFIVDLIIFFIGTSFINLSEKLIEAVLFKVFLEVVGFIYLVINYLFKPIDTEMDKLLEKLQVE